MEIKDLIRWINTYWKGSNVTFVNLEFFGVSRMAFTTENCTFGTKLVSFYSCTSMHLNKFKVYFSKVITIIIKGKFWLAKSNLSTKSLLIKFGIAYYLCMDYVKRKNSKLQM